MHEYVFIENDTIFNENTTIVFTSTHRLRIVFISFSLETVFKSYRFQSFSCRYKVEMQKKVCGFDENDMKTYSCRQGLTVHDFFDIIQYRLRKEIIDL